MTETLLLDKELIFRSLLTLILKQSTISLVFVINLKTYNIKKKEYSQRAQSLFHPSTQSSASQFGAYLGVEESPEAFVVTSVA